MCVKSELTRLTCVRRYDADFAILSAKFIKSALALCLMLNRKELMASVESSKDFSICDRGGD